MSNDEAWANVEVGREFDTPAAEPASGNLVGAHPKQNVRSASGQSRRYYIPVRAKFLIALALAGSWLLFSVIVSRPWYEELGAVTHPLFALICLTFIAYVPGFMNAFLVVSLLLDRRPPRVQLDHYPGLTVLVAAYQEERTIIHTLASLAKENYPGEIEVLVLNDGSTDKTVEAAERGRTGLHFKPNVTVKILDFKENRGKAAVLNDGLAAASHDLIVTVDADTRLRADSLTKLVERLSNDPPNTVAVAGAILVGNSRATLMAGLQEWDYFHGIAAVKRMQSMYHGTLVAQGAFSIYRKGALVEVGGWADCIGEDIVLTWALLSKGWRTGYAEDAVAFTSAPTSYRVFALQRKRWARGLVEALARHEPLLFKRRLTTMFIWWNLLFLPMDVVFTFVFLPGVIAAFFGYFWIAGPMTLLTLPLALMWNLVIFRIQQRMFHGQGLKVRRHWGALVVYIVGYAALMQPVSLWGYSSELIGRQKKWGTK
ncbi:glycosyltransferase [Sphingomonas xanthus]|uniref:Glycosyltransferase family 2 protein n=1 Tax=Sphingomonas xanthus TaxID=2594473 RepID=A0A516INK7_9SPHN|nr:glycosyltransferase [Sphingomonas xanthus]QDP18485.1 glycosyltransferase family 2 protein [Sphingomonas xanthus]